MSLNIPTPQKSDPADYNESAPQGLHRLAVPLDLGGLRLDAGLARLMPAHSRSRLQTWIREGRVSRDGAVLTDTRAKLLGGEILEIAPGATPQTQAATPEDIPLEAVFEDEHILVINKPAGLVVHPGSGNWSGTLLNALLAHDEEMSELPRAGIVHRLDKDTSGLMVVAKTLEAQTDLVRQLQARTVKREYRAVVIGLPPMSGTVDAPIGRHPTQRTKMAVVGAGKPAVTHFRQLRPFVGAALVECALETGRTHQIRVHMAHIGHPLIGDPVYAVRRRPPAAAADFARQALHAYRLGLLHPATGKALAWEAPMPADMLALIEALASGEAPHP
ncbi:MAG: 23S rRNA pseudouridine(1911/1915/1917) synthase RluD [Rhodocyclaceae bacterium]